MTTVPVTILQGSGFQLRPFGECSHIANLFQDFYLTATDERMKRFTQVPDPYSEEECKKFLSNISGMTWAIIVDDRYCGNITLREQPHDCVDVGYCTAPWARGKGLMTKVLSLLMDYAFHHGIHRFEVKAHVDNAASRHVAEQAGARFEGIARHGERNKGRWHDLAVYARLSTD